MTSTISTWGNSQGLRLPKNIMKELNFSIGDKVNISIQKQNIILKPLKNSRDKYDINDLVKKIPHNFQTNKTNKTYEEFNNKSGLEEC